MNCLDFDRLLDVAELAALPKSASAHARSCARCAQALRAAQSLESALARVLTSPSPQALGVSAPALPVEFTSRVLAQVRARDARALVLAEPGPFPWWMDAAAHPASLLACSVLALVLWKGSALVALVRLGAGETSAAAGAAMAALLQAGAWCAPLVHTYHALMAQGWQGQMAGSVMLLTLGAILGRMAFRASERLASAFAGL